KEDSFLHLRRSPKLKTGRSGNSPQASPSGLPAQGNLRSGTITPTATCPPTLSRHNTLKNKNREPHEMENPFDDVLAGYTSEFDEDLKRMDAVEEYLEDRIDFFAGQRGSAQSFGFSKKSR